MGDISKNFSRWEYECKCGCGLDVVDKELNEVEEDLRDYFEARVTNKSANRCYAYNEKVQFKYKKGYVAGTSKSKHKLCKAADVVVEGVNPHAVYEYLHNKYPDKYGLGDADGFTHIDVRPNRARWGY